MIRTYLPVCILLWFWPGPAWTQPPEEPATLPETTVVGEASGTPDGTPEVAFTPTRTETPIREFGGSVSVIGAALIGNSEQPFLRNLLQTVPGLDLQQNGGPGRVATVFLRGQSSRATKVLIDGIPVNDPSSPMRTFDFGSLNALEVERVEVLRGPQSTLYGSDAVGGVINIITRRGEGPGQGWLSSQAGSRATYDNVGHLSGGTSNYHYSFGVSTFATRGLSVDNERHGRFFDIEDDSYRQATLSTRFGWTPTENFDVDVVLRYLRGETQLDSFNQPPFTLITDDLLANSSSEQFYGRAAARWTWFGGDWENRIAYNHFHINRDFEDPNSFFSPFSLFHGGTDMVEYQANLRMTENNTATFGAMYLVEQFDNPPGQADPLSQSDIAFYFQDQISVQDRWFTTIGIRHDDYELAGPATTWRAASIFHIERTASALHGSYGTGFIAPSLFEQFAFLPPFAFGNPNLKPERARGFEFGFEQGFFNRMLTVDVTYFRIDSEDLIQFVLPTFENVGRARASGVEVIATVNIGRNSSLVMNYTNTNALDLDQDRPLQLRPDHKGSVTFNRRLLGGRGNWYLQLVAIGKRFDYAVPEPLQRMPPHAVVNTAFWYDLRPNVRALLRIDNLFDADYEEVVGFGTTPFSAFAGVKFTLGREKRGRESFFDCLRAKGNDTVKR